MTQYITLFCTAAFTLNCYDFESKVWMCLALSESVCQRTYAWVVRLDQFSADINLFNLINWASPTNACAEPRPFVFCFGNLGFSQCNFGHGSRHGRLPMSFKMRLRLGKRSRVTHRDGHRLRLRLMVSLSESATSLPQWKRRWIMAWSSVPWRLMMSSSSALAGAHKAWESYEKLSESSFLNFFYFYL